MGFRYRKSINLGGGFRINLSKSGIGYSGGVKGYRITKTARGTVRHTASIPGSGISYVDETGKKKNTNYQQFKPSIDANHYATEEIVNSIASTMVSDGLEDILDAARRTLKANSLANIGFWVSLILSFVNPLFIILIGIFVGLKIYAKIAGVIDLDYTIDDDQKEIIAKRMEPMFNVTKSDKIWRIIQSSKVIDKKYSGGAANTVKRISCQATIKPPFPFKANIPSASFKTGKEILVFLPDKLFILQGSKIGALNYSDIITSSYTTRFIESERVPRDANIVDRTWKYVNKSGGPDKRFRDNRELPICQYGEIELKSTSGLNSVIMFSNANMN